ncbi:MAG: hypothetical protein M1839_003555 [Geoglossum umbratile]|nr:MAG: hypothetical protein M1839_003555 [Geoglossum umbratile]
MIPQAEDEPSVTGDPSSAPTNANCVARYSASESAPGPTPTALHTMLGSEPVPHPVSGPEPTDTLPCLESSPTQTATTSYTKHTTVQETEPGTPPTPAPSRPRIEPKPGHKLTNISLQILTNSKPAATYLGIQSGPEPAPASGIRNEPSKTLSGSDTQQVRISDHDDSSITRLILTGSSESFGAPAAQEPATPKSPPAVGKGSLLVRGSSPSTANRLTAPQTPKKRTLPDSTSPPSKKPEK